MDLIVFI